MSEQDFETSHWNAGEAVVVSPPADYPPPAEGPVTTWSLTKPDKTPVGDLRFNDGGLDWSPAEDGGEYAAEVLSFLRGNAAQKTPLADVLAAISNAYAGDYTEDNEVQAAEQDLALFSDEGLRTLLAAVEADHSDDAAVVALPSEGGLVHDIGDEEKHATVAYLGEITPELAGQREALEQHLQRVADQGAPFTASVSGVDELGDEGAKVWMLDSPELAQLHEAVFEGPAEDASGYPSFTPHSTITYDTAPPESADVKEIPFDRLALWWGNDRVEYPLGGDAEFEALLFGFVEDEHPRGSAGSGQGGQFIPKSQGSGGQAKGKGGKAGGSVRSPKKPKLTKQQREKAIVKGVLDALSDVMKDLTSAQAKALIERIKSNAEAFIEGQAAAPHHGGAKKGSHPAKGGAKRGAKGSLPSGSGTSGGGKSAGPAAGPAHGSQKAIVNTVKALLKGFEHNMKPAHRNKMKQALKKLEEM